jgi:hypothetical protein
VGQAISLLNRWPTVDRQTFATRLGTDAVDNSPSAIRIGPGDCAIWSRLVFPFVLLAMSLQTRSRCLCLLISPIQFTLTRCLPIAVFPRPDDTSIDVAPTDTKQAPPGFDAQPKLYNVQRASRERLSELAYMRPGDTVCSPIRFPQLYADNNTLASLSRLAQHTFATPASILHGLSFTRFDMA